MHRSLRCPLRFTVFLLFLLTCALSGTALASVTTGVIKGTTIDEDGLPIPGVLVTIESEALLGGGQQRNTDDKGRFAFFELSPGEYIISAEKAGFGKITKTGLPVNIGRTTTVDLEMSMQESGEEIVVEAARPTIDTEQTSKGEVLTKDFLQRVPTGRSYQSAVAATPGVVGGSNPNVGGAGYNENTYMLDGVNITDPVTGTFSVNFNFDAIEQLEVITNALDPEYGEGLGGVVNIVTESGSNRLEFDTRVIYENGNWSPKTDARYASDGLEIAPSGFDYNSSFFEADAKIAGPIVRDRAWYILSYTYVRGLYSDIGIDIPMDWEGHSLLSKLSFQPTTAHRFTLLAHTDPAVFDNTNQGDRYVDATAQSRQAQGGYVGSAQWDWFISPEAFLETKLTYQKSFIEVYGVPCTHDKGLGYHPCEADEEENSLDFETPGRIGYYNAFDSGNYYRYYFDDRFNYNLTSKLSLLQIDLAGIHDIKTGIELERTGWDQVQGFTGNTMFYDANSVTYSPSTYTNWYWYETSGPFHYNASGDEFSWFIQDAYKPIQNLTVRYGVRYDRAVQRDDAGDRVVDVSLWGPRLFAVWDPWGDGKTAIRGGYGRVNDTGRLAVAAFNSSTQSFGYKLFFGEVYSGYYNNYYENGYEYDTGENKLVFDNMTAPHADEFLLGAQREIVQDLAVGVSFMARFSKNIYDYDEVNFIWDDDGYSVIGTDNGELEGIYRLRSADIARRDYYQADFQLKKNYADRWQLLATYSYIVSRGLVQESLEGALVIPEQVDLWYGNLWTDMRHQIKGGGSYDIPNDPWTTEVGFWVDYASGWPYSRLYYLDNYSDDVAGYGFLLDNRGTYTRVQPIWEADILVQQAMPVKRGKLWAIAEVENIFNLQYADGRNASYVYVQNRWVITSRQNTMRFNLSVRYEF